MSESNDIILTPNVLLMLQQVEKVFRQFGIDYFMAGAFARDLHFENKESKKPMRRTDDVDIAICIDNEEQFHELVKALEATGDFTQKKNEPIKLIYKLGIEMDLIPFGKIENEHRKTKIYTPKVFVINMPGFAETAPFTVDVNFGRLTLKICPIEGLIMLKLISWNDKKNRTHDLTDIDHLIDASEDWMLDEIFESNSDLLDIYDVNDLQYYMKRITAHLIGRKMRTILNSNNDLKSRVIGILEKQTNPRWEAIRNGLIEK